MAAFSSVNFNFQKMFAIECTPQAISRVHSLHASKNFTDRPGLNVFFEEETVGIAIFSSIPTEFGMVGVACTDEELNMRRQTYPLAQLI